MPKALLLDDDPRFIIAAQKLFPHDTEWLATADLAKADDLVGLLNFDVIMVRKKHEQSLQDLLMLRMQEGATGSKTCYKKLVVLPRFFWRTFLRAFYRKGLLSTKAS